MTDDCSLDEITALLDDETSRTILVETRTEPMSADQLSDRCGVSKSTVYRRVATLRELDLLEERTRPVDGGHHYTVYAATLDKMTIDIQPDGFVVELDRKESMTDRFTRIIEEI